MDLQEVAERIVGASLEPLKAFRTYDGVDHVVRYAIDGGRQTVFAKRGGKWGEGRWDLHNEWAALQLLDGAYAPKLIGGDADEGVIVFEDLGECVTLADRLLGDDATLAGDAVIAFAKALGGMHARTLDRADEFEAIRRPMSDEPYFGRTIFARNATLIGDFRSVCDRLGVEVPAAVIDRCERAVADPSLTALTHGDACPDNVFLTPAGAKFIDFEYAGFRHPMLDGVYARVPFATCWCVNQLPPLVVDAFESAYRTALGSPSWFDEAAMDWWLFWLLHTTVWGFDALEEADGEWGIATRRQRLVLRWGEFADRAADTVLAAFGGRVRDAVAERWPETEPMPLYPAFR